MEQREFEYLDEQTGERKRVLRTFFYSSFDRTGDPASDRLIPFPHLEPGEEWLEAPSGEVVIVRVAKGGKNS